MCVHTYARITTGGRSRCDTYLKPRRPTDLTVSGSPSAVSRFLCNDCIRPRESGNTPSRGSNGSCTDSSIRANRLTCTRPTIPPTSDCTVYAMGDSTSSTRHGPSQGARNFRLHSISLARCDESASSLAKRLLSHPFGCSTSPRHLAHSLTPCTTHRAARAAYLPVCLRSPRHPVATVPQCLHRTRKPPTQTRLGKASPLSRHAELCLNRIRQVRRGGPSPCPRNRHMRAGP